MVERLESELTGGRTQAFTEVVVDETGLEVDGRAVEVVAGVVMLAIAGWCAARLVAPGLRVPEHGRSLEVWHLLMVGAMALMLLASVPGPPALGIAVFAFGAVWALVRAGRDRLRGAHLRTATASAAMVVMLVPSPASAAPMPGMHEMHATTPTGARPMSDVPGLVVAVLVVALAAVVAASAVRLLRRTTAPAARVDAACEALMTAAMAAMLLALF